MYTTSLKLYHFVGYYLYYQVHSIFFTNKSLCRLIILLLSLTNPVLKRELVYLRICVITGKT